MRQHFAALERLVAMGLSPQAARAALRSMDEWLVSKAGAAEMARAEVMAREAGEPILHIGDHVQLEGLVKNAAANGKMALLQTYVAESQRWKVALSDGKAYLLQPKFLRPVAQRPSAHLQQLEQADQLSPERSSASGNGNEAPPAQVAALDGSWRELEQSQMAWKEVQEAKEIELLEKEESLRRQQEELEAQQRIITERRRSIAIDQARSLAAMEQSSIAASPEPSRGPDGRRLTAEFVMDDISVLQTTAGASEDVPSEVGYDEEDEGEAEADDVWDMDWSALAPPSPSAPATVDAGSAACFDDHLEMLPHSDPASASTAGLGQKPASAARSAAAPPEASNMDSMDPAEREELQRKLEEKRRLAEQHNGEDLTNKVRSNLTKESMPGAHPALAAKLEEKRRRLEQAEEERQASGSEDVEAI